MPLRRTAVALAVVALSVGLIAGCSKNDSSNSSGQSSSGAPLPSATELLKQSSDTTRGQQSVHLELKVDKGLQEKLPIESLSGDLTNVPAVAAQGTAKVILGNQAVERDFVVVNGDLWVPLTKGGKMQNFGPAKDIYDVGLILNPDQGLANVLSNFVDPKADSRENKNGVNTVKIVGKVSKDAVNAIAPQLEVTDAVPATAWIREDGDHALVEAQLEATQGNSVTMTTSDWGKPVTVNQP
jgi:lipoprotein LprG